MIIIYMIFILVFSVTTSLARVITLPFSETFESAESVSDILYGNLSCPSAVVAWDSGGWSGGGVKLTPPSGGEGQCTIGIGGLDFSPYKDTINIRIMVKFGPEYVDNPYSTGWGMQNKFMIITPSSGGTRGMTILERNADANPDDYTFGVCSDNSCLYSDTGRDSYEWFSGCFTEPNHYHFPRADGLFNLRNYLDQWIVFELMVDGPGKQTKIFIWTADGVFNGQYLMTLSGSCVGWTNTVQWTAIQAIGGFFNGGHTASANTWIKFDNLAVQTSPSGGFIGPPAGFGLPSSATGCVLSGASLQ
jgi:hypothetical protein